MKVKPSLLVSSMSGRHSGGVLSKNDGGRIGKKPSNPQSADQQNVRALFAQLSRGWALLSDSQQIGRAHV